MKSREWKLGKVWFVEATALSPWGTTNCQDHIHRERKAQGTLSPYATATSARGSGQGKLPEEGIHIFILSLGEAR